MNTVEALKELYKSFGGKLTDTYDDIADGIPVGNYSVIPDCFAALAEIAGGSIELPVVTQADAGDVLTVGEDGKWTNEEPAKELPTVTATDNGSVLSVVDGAWAKKSGIIKHTETVTIGSGQNKIALGLPADEVAIGFDISDADTKALMAYKTVYMNQSYSVISSVGEVSRLVYLEAGGSNTFNAGSYKIDTYTIKL